MSPILAVLVLAALAQDGPPTPDESLAALRLADPALTVELVASEPDVMDPVAVAWDEFGRMYVVEMTDYPVAPPGGRIKRLEDRDGDGRYEHADVFADSLPYPSGVLPWNGGVLVTAAPDLLFLKDADGDGRAEVREVVLTGFAEGNQQLRVNSPTWGRDNWVYLANGRSGGAVRLPGDPAESAVPIPRSDLRVSPATGEAQAVAGFSQFGLPRDDRGDRFPSWNTVPLRHVVLESPGGVADILDPSDGGRIYSLSPAQRRFNPESVAYFNATCGPTIERGGGLGPAYRGDAFACEPLSSVVHRRRLIPDGPTYIAQRVESRREFLASEHPWFRPVNLANGPDGALYVVDFCRAWVEHPAFVPEGQRYAVDFREGHDRGRIWRVRVREANRPTPCRPGTLSASELVDVLAHPNGWCRDTAQRLLVERNDPRSVEPLRQLASSGTSSLGRAHAIWTLDGLDHLDVTTLQKSLHDPDALVREAAARLAARHAGLLDDLARLIDDPDARVRLRVAEGLAGHEGEVAREAVARLTIRDAGSPWMTTAILEATRAAPLDLFETLARLDPALMASPSQAQAGLLTRLAEMVGERNDESELSALARRIGEKPDRTAGLALLLGLAKGQGRLASAQISWDGPPHGPRAEALEPLRASAVAWSADGDRPAWERVMALEAALATRAPGVPERLIDGLEPAEPPEFQGVAVRGLGRLATPEQADRALEGWGRYTLATRRALARAFASRAPLAERLLTAVEQGSVAPEELDPTTRESLRDLNEHALRKRVAALHLDAPASDRGEVVRRLRPALSLESRPDRGRELFVRHCGTCHAREGEGAKVGPDLIGLVGRPPEDLLTAILDPSRDVPPDGLGVVVATSRGQVLSGLLVEESAGTIRLRMPEGQDEVIPRAEVTALRPTGRSLMPEGFEQVLGPQELADLIAYLRAAEAVDQR